MEDYVSAAEDALSLEYAKDLNNKILTLSLSCGQAKPPDVLAK